MKYILAFIVIMLMGISFLAGKDLTIRELKKQIYPILDKYSVELAMCHSDQARIETILASADIVMEDVK